MGGGCIDGLSDLRARWSQAANVAKKQTSFHGESIAGNKYSLSNCKNKILKSVIDFYHMVKFHFSMFLYS